MSALLLCERHVPSPCRSQILEIADAYRGDSEIAQVTTDTFRCVGGDAYAWRLDFYCDSPLEVAGAALVDDDFVFGEARVVLFSYGDSGGPPLESEELRARIVLESPADGYGGLNLPAPHLYPMGNEVGLTVRAPDLERNRVLKATADGIREVPGGYRISSFQRLDDEAPYVAMTRSPYELRLGSCSGEERIPSYVGLEYPLQIVQGTMVPDTQRARPILEAACSSLLWDTDEHAAASIACLRFSGSTVAEVRRVMAEHLALEREGGPFGSCDTGDDWLEIADQVPPFVLN